MSATDKPLMGQLRDMTADKEENARLTRELAEAKAALDVARMMADSDRRFASDCEGEAFSAAWVQERMGRIVAQLQPANPPKAEPTGEAKGYPTTTISCVMCFGRPLDKPYDCKNCGRKIGQGTGQKLGEEKR